MEYRVAVAYVTFDGARTLERALSDVVGAGWAGIPKTVVTCFDFGHTDPGALELLRDKGWSVRIANLTASGEVAIHSQASYHPKVYLAVEGTGSVRCVVGSANLSRRALTVNTEAVNANSLAAAEVDRMWSDLERASVPLTPELLAEYVALRPDQRGVPRVAEPPVPEIPVSSSLPAFGHVVETGALSPVEFESFWIEVGGPSGGSGSQLELPRGGNRFFGFTYDTYDDEQRTIGSVTLTAAGGEWARELAWHGDNRMERINLPTRAMSGFSYARRVVLFVRLGNGRFELAVADPASTRAGRWRDEAAAGRSLFRFGPNSPRRCGLF